MQLHFQVKLWDKFRENSFDSAFRNSFANNDRSGVWEGHPRKERGKQARMPPSRPDLITKWDFINISRAQLRPIPFYLRLSETSHFR